ncbi:HEPN domain-containing protein [Mycolicibacterium holsaticum]|uniref:HEPN domain-containing protein n=1 Tax=Mycolicibacterium holsaticum TaxID=152142 RepID=UPI001C7CAE3B|nr:HEPN domain-containing protein [Mycolicibacterium holsaticum]MDA4109716.1 hypothetical protein [Mycolicibacterium holsaticum DSM 44478 = JCM 12374]QZA10642.1 hypothetical protein K3U96_15250 [Mycolicibacterium holsaticum DSM 44478 = JCM 12374]UNC11853.1 hypothetical protein H5U41_11580 [Mycolicibacterium holsaticum DSM 44478 = JCM 12374]
MTYSFRNRFRLRDGDRLDADVHTITLADSEDDGLVTLRPVRRNTEEQDTAISEAAELVLRGVGYGDADAAWAAGRKWRQCLTATLAREFMGVDLGPDNRETPTIDVVITHEPSTMLQSIGLQAGDRTIGDGYRLLVYRTDPDPTFLTFTMGPVTLRLSGWLDRFQQRMSEARERDHQIWDTQKTIAYQLVHQALLDSNPETRHIQLVTAIEVLFKEQRRPQPVLDALDKLLSDVAEWSECDAKTSISEILRQDKKESISRTGQEYVSARLRGTYRDMTPAAFFKDVYGIRSRLVHGPSGNKPRPTNDELNNIWVDVLKFALDLLDTCETE